MASADDQEVNMITITGIPAVVLQKQEKNSEESISQIKACIDYIKVIANENGTLNLLTIYRFTIFHIYHCITHFRIAVSAFNTFFVIKPQNFRAEMPFTNNRFRHFCSTDSRISLLPDYIYRLLT